MGAEGLLSTNGSGWLISSIGGLDHVDSFVERLRVAKWPDDVLPLAADRIAFSGISSDTLRSYCFFIDRYPEVLGRFVRLIRAQAGVPQTSPGEFVIKEAHIDVSETSDALLQLLVEQGFEPDHFLTPNPKEYRDCYTLRFEIPISLKNRAADIDRVLKSRLANIERELSIMPGILAYSEIESYTHEHKRVYSYMVPTEQALSEFPFVSGEFQERSTTKGKKADVHVKLPGMVDERQDELAVVRHNRLKTQFLATGFFEIRSLSGNIIYTLQMQDVKRARAVFDMLSVWADAHRCIKGLEVEFCSHFWRKTERVPGGVHISPVPPIIPI
jgi:hypothetical protein